MQDGSFNKSPFAAQRRQRYHAYWNAQRWQPGVWTLGVSDRRYTISIEDAETVHWSNRALSNMRNPPTCMQRYMKD